MCSPGEDRELQVRDRTLGVRATCLRGALSLTKEDINVGREVAMSLLRRNDDSLGKHPRENEPK